MTHLVTRYADEAQTLAMIDTLCDAVIAPFSPEEFENIALIGIQRRGFMLVEKMVGRITEKTNKILRAGALDTTMYRDDIGRGNTLPKIAPTHLNFSFENSTVILVDDVLQTGRTIRAALDALTDFGRPKAIRLACLIDRGDRELPIQPDFCVKRIDPIPKNEWITLHQSAETGLLYLTHSTK